jgi:hypothetical protein
MEGCAMFSSTSYDPETLGVLNRVFDEAWIDIRKLVGPTPVDADGLRLVLAKRIIAAAATGERDTRRLKLIAMGAIDA